MRGRTMTGFEEVVDEIGSLATHFHIVCILDGLTTCFTFDLDWPIA